MASKGGLCRWTPRWAWPNPVALPLCTSPFGELTPHFKLSPLVQHIGMASEQPSGPKEECKMFPGPTASGEGSDVLPSEESGVLPPEGASGSQWAHPGGR